MIEKIQSGPDAPVIILLVGPAGAGKTSIMQKLLSRNRKATLIPTLTTRSMRVGESEGNPYNFVSRERFLHLARSGDLLEWTEVSRNFYGVSRSVVSDLIKHGRDLITDVEVGGAHRLLLAYPFTLCALFIAPPSREELVRRIRARHPVSDFELEARLRRAEVELAMANSFDYLVINSDFEQSVDRVESIISAHKSSCSMVSYGLSRGMSPSFRTISFDLGFGGAVNPCSVSLRLPKTRLGPIEDYGSAFQRVLMLLSLRCPLPFQEFRFDCVGASELEHRHLRPWHYSELETVCRVRSNAANMEVVKSAVDAWNLTVPFDS